MTTCRCGYPAPPDDCLCARCQALGLEARREVPTEPDGPTPPTRFLERQYPHVRVRPGMAGEVLDPQGAVLAYVTCAALGAGLAAPYEPTFDAVRSGWLLLRTPDRGERTLPEVLAMGRPMRHLHGDPRDAWAWASFWAFPFWPHRLPTDRTKGLGLGEEIVVWFPRHTWTDQLTGSDRVPVCPTCGWAKADCHCEQRRRAARESCW